jgi:plastocyanin
MNKKTTIWVIVLLIVVGAIGAGVYFATKPADTTPATQKETNTNSTSNNNADTSTASATITYADSGFAPSTLTIKKGQTIKIVNNSSSPMQFSSADHPTHLQDPELNMATLSPGESGTVIPETVGTHGYHDHLKAEHTGSITVTE